MARVGRVFHDVALELAEVSAGLGHDAYGLRLLRGVRVRNVVPLLRYSL